MIVVVLGMHRSGTSAVANVLQHLGVNMGDRLFEANQWNPQGYYEDVDFFDVNVELVHAAGGHWGDPPEATRIREVGAWFIPQMVQIVRWKERARGVWGWKDPRTAITMPVWWEAIRQVGVQDVRIVRTVRSQWGMLQSLAKRAREASALAVETGEEDAGLAEMATWENDWWAALIPTTIKLAAGSVTATWENDRWAALIHEYELRALQFLGDHPDVPCMTVRFEELVRAETTRKVVSGLAEFVEADARLVEGAVEQVVAR